ncbi:VOC family protein [Chitinibacter tainanensis]|uniref:VOC family protein n=1 Tax=Chitinibacter tainanensis TaxID=230667 RepID=UPI000415962E|nr:VOC family protein [Chitinibacter tainanensis]
MIASLDHWVLTTGDLARCLTFYQQLGLRAVEFAPGRWALHFGQQKINLHEAGAEISPHARYPQPGSQDWCWLVSEPLAQVQARLQALGIAIEQGPVRRQGAGGPLWSIYLRDPDGNLLELAEQDAASAIQE